MTTKEQAKKWADRQVGGLEKDLAKEAKKGGLVKKVFIAAGILVVVGAVLGLVIFS